MSFHKFLARQRRTEGPLFQMLAQICASAIALTFLVLMSGCNYQATTPERDLNMRDRPQIRCFSLSPSNQASLVIENTRELRISSDGGKTWQVIPSTAVNAFECATLIDDKRGWAVNHDGHVFATQSGGANWNKVWELKDFTGASQIEFLNANDGWIREFLSIWRTRDGGITWHPTFSVATPGVKGQPSGMFPLNADVLVSSGGDGQVYLTKDGGATWRIETPLAGEIALNDVWFVDQKHGWLTGYQVLRAGKTLRPLLFETTNGGDSWKEISVQGDMGPSSVCFVGDKGWLVGSRRIVSDDSVKLVGVLLLTEDAGKSWTEVQIAEEPFFTEVRFTDPTHGWLVGRDRVYTTADGGKSWKTVLSLRLNSVTPNKPGLEPQASKSY